MAGASWAYRLPTFARQEDVPPAWASYLEGVYGTGALSKITFPLALRSFDVFHDRLLPTEQQPLVRARPLLGESTGPNASTQSSSELQALQSVPRPRRRHAPRLRRAPLDVFSMWPSTSHAFVYHYGSTRATNATSDSKSGNTNNAVRGGDSPALVFTEEPLRLRQGHPSHALVEVLHCFQDPDEYAERPNA